MKFADQRTNEILKAPCTPNRSLKKEVFSEQWSLNKQTSTITVQIKSPSSLLRGGLWGDGIAAVLGVHSSLLQKAGRGRQGVH